MRWFNGGISIPNAFTKMWTLLNIFLSFWVKGVEGWPKFVLIFSIESPAFFHLLFHFRLCSLLLTKNQRFRFIYRFIHITTLHWSICRLLVLGAREPTLKSFHITHPISIVLHFILVLLRLPTSLARLLNICIYLYLFIYPFLTIPFRIEALNIFSMVGKVLLVHKRMFQVGTSNFI